MQYVLVNAKNMILQYKKLLILSTLTIKNKKYRITTA